MELNLIQVATVTEMVGTLIHQQIVLFLIQVCNTGDDCVAIKSGKNPEGNGGKSSVKKYQSYRLRK